MKRFVCHLITIVTLFASSAYARTSDEMAQLARDLNLYAGEKASVQWKRIFISPRHMKRYKVDTLSPDQRAQLMQYLINHAADSDQPIVPGL